ncbi:MAG: hypothetical protein ACK46O_00750 [Flavobacteriia bacterium]
MEHREERREKREERREKREERREHGEERREKREESMEKREESMEKREERREKREESMEHGLKDRNQLILFSLTVHRFRFGDYLIHRNKSMFQIKTLNLHQRSAAHSHPTFVSSNN